MDRTLNKETNVSAITEAGSSKFIDVTEGEINGSIHVNDAGNGDEVVVMFHGSGPGASGWSNFHRNVDAFVDAGYRVLLIDSPGFNKSYPIVTKSRDGAYAQAAKGVLDKLGIKRAHMIGNSMGGATAMRMAVDYPEMVGKLIMMGGGSVGASTTVPMPTEGLKLLQGLYRNPTMENLRKMLDIFVYAPSTLTEDLINGRFENMMRRTEHLSNFVESLKSSGGRANYAHLLPTLTMPTMIIWGRDDRFVPLDLGLRMLWGMPDAELHVFSKCGHWAQWEHADKFNQLVLNFLAR
ncbi:alpha/beta fold hydrolase (plasmid) [Diaphorobacter sp. HDW4B]|uniref:alpha/beta fold hydrolase n=1 Tax=Diaphorobacter sp. HDW4B TaxID=2714925 RepID=UPI00140A9AA0|nr:alpha/beta fold hydrolase [Diaphorobacter sp. HDW4B]QIL73944.1 alpha/beta fold hydrolase [Diaphorobacter sp. HDW4B]